MSVFHRVWKTTSLQPFSSKEECRLSKATSVGEPGTTSRWHWRPPPAPTPKRSGTRSCGPRNLQYPPWKRVWNKHTNQLLEWLQLSRIRSPDELVCHHPGSIQNGNALILRFRNCQGYLRASKKKRVTPLLEQLVHHNTKKRMGMDLVKRERLHSPIHESGEERTTNEHCKCNQSPRTVDRLLSTRPQCCVLQTPA